jgi:hypothetical protein
MQSIFLLSSSASKKRFLHLFMKRRWIRNFSFDWMFFRGCVSFCQNVIWRVEHLATFFEVTTFHRDDNRSKWTPSWEGSRDSHLVARWRLMVEHHPLIFFRPRTSWLYSFEVADLRSWKNRIRYWCMGRRIRYSGGPFRSAHPSYSLGHWSLWKSSKWSCW